MGSEPRHMGAADPIRNRRREHAVGKHQFGWRCGESSSTGLLREDMVVKRNQSIPPEVTAVTCTAATTDDRADDVRHGGVTSATEKHTCADRVGGCRSSAGDCGEGISLISPVIRTTSTA